MRKLSLSKEVLAELTTDELGIVLGAAASGALCPTNPCITPPVSQLRCTFTLAPEVCGG